MNKDKMYFSSSERQANTPIGLSLGLAVVWEWPETKQQTNQPLRRAPTFFQIVLHAGTATRASDWQRLGTGRPHVSSQAPERAERQQQGYYGPDSLCVPTGSTCGSGAESTGVSAGVRAGPETGMSIGDVWRVKGTKEEGEEVLSELIGDENPVILKSNARRICGMLQLLELRATAH